jgi:hypothetical protein
MHQNVPTVTSLIEAALGDAYIVFPTLALFGGATLLPAIWALAPVVWSEVSPPDAHKTTKQPYTSRLGAWLNLALNALLFAGFLLYTAIMIAAPLAVVFKNELAFGDQGRAAIAALGTISAAAFVWLFAWRGKAKDLALGFRPVLDAMLDVDNWFREHPLDRNPKSRICGRYVSLLRYICNWTNPLDGSHYDAIVIVSHSQGTVISADLLRFLHHEAEQCGSVKAYDPELERLADKGFVSLYTMGSPLRALYGERFPRLYAWAYHDPGSTDRPDPDELNVKQWINSYRSGDYIGRHLWQRDNNAGNWTVTTSPAPAAPGVTNRLEHCIGAGAHTHYWDETGPAIRDEVDALIANA